MKTLFIAVVLSFTSVCWSAPLACNDLLREVDNAPNLVGRWYIVAVSLDSCPFSALINFLYPSLRADFTQGEAPNVYDVLFTGKIYGHCANESTTLLYSSGKLMSYDKDTQETTVTDSLLQTSCPDCIVAKTLTHADMLLLLSRRQYVDGDEMNEFVKQAECLKSRSPVVLNTDHDFDNCTAMEDMDEDIDPALRALLTKKGEEFGKAVVACIMAYVASLYESITNWWS